MWKTLWAVSRPHNVGKFARAEEGTDALLHIEVGSGKVLGEQPLDSRFTHDAFRMNNGEGDILIADTSKGKVLRYEVDSKQNTIKLKNRLGQGIDGKNHLNTIYERSNEQGYIILHGKGRPSRLVEIDFKSGNLGRENNVFGKEAHSIQLIEETGEILVLDSQGCRLVAIDQQSLEISRILFDCSSWEPPRFMKGLCAVPGPLGKVKNEQLKSLLFKLKTAWLSRNKQVYALLGVNTASPREARGKTNLQGTIVALDIPLDRSNQDTRIVWQRELPTNGLLNAIVLPYTLSERRAKHVESEEQPHTCYNTREERWLQAANDGSLFSQITSPILRLPLKLDTEELSKIADWLQSMPEKWQQRVQNNGTFNFFIHLITSEGLDTEKKMGPMKLYSDGLLNNPEANYLRQIINTMKIPVGRSRLMKVLPGESVSKHRDVKRHIKCPYHRDCAHKLDEYRDRIGPSVQLGYWGRRFRVHIPLLSDSSNVNFIVKDVAYHMKVGEVWIFDNSYFHEVENLSTQDRIHAVFDTVGSSYFFDLIARSKSNSSEFRDEDLTYIPLPPFDSTSLGLVLEEWVDSPPFEPMPFTKIIEYLQPIGSRIINREDRELFEMFTMTLKEKLLAIPSAKLLQDLWRPVLNPKLIQEIQANISDVRIDFQRKLCDARMYNTSLTVADAVEVFLDQNIFFKCIGLTSDVDDVLPSSSSPCFKQISNGEDS